MGRSEVKERREGGRRGGREERRKGGRRQKEGETNSNSEGKRMDVEEVVAHEAKHVQELIWGIYLGCRTRGNVNANDR